MQDTVIKEKGKKVMLWKFSCQLRNDAEICKITDRIGIGWNQALSWEIVGKKQKQNTLAVFTAGARAMVSGCRHKILLRSGLCGGISLKKKKRHRARAPCSGTKFEYNYKKDQNRDEKISCERERPLIH